MLGRGLRGDFHSIAISCLPVFCIFVHFVVPMGISPMGNLGRIQQEKPAATELCYPTLINDKVHAGFFVFP